MEPEVYRQAREFRGRLLDQEENARRAILEAYQIAYTSLLSQIERLVAWLIERGEPITLGQLTRLDRWKQLQAQMLVELERFGGAAAAAIAQAQRLQLSEASQQALELMRLSSPVARAFAALPTGALEQLVGFLQDGSPVAVRIAEAFPGLVERVKRELIAGLASGVGIRVIARKIAAQLEPPAGKRGQGKGPLAVALRTARTEILRAHREASRETYQRNSDVVQGWIWLSARGTHTCAACLAMDGTTHTLSQPMGSHPNCRCTLLPWLIGDPAPSDTGEAWLARQSLDVQARVLGRDAPDRDAARAFREGTVRLSDFVQERYSRTWGTTRTAKSFSQVLDDRAKAR